MLRHRIVPFPLTIRILIIEKLRYRRNKLYISDFALIALIKQIQEFLWTDQVVFKI